MTTPTLRQASVAPQTSADKVPLQAAQPPLQPGGTAPAICWPNIPAPMRERPQWAIAVGDKQPRREDGRAASATDPTTWTTFERACAAAAKLGGHVGYMLAANDPFTIIDLDVKKDSDPAHIARCHRIVDEFASYTERSRSGLGFHIVVEAKIEAGRKRDGIEVYSRERFMICTGDVTANQPIAQRQGAVDRLVGEMPSAPERTMLGTLGAPNAAVVEAARIDPGELGRLFRGEWQGRYPSQSEADLSLAKRLLEKCASPEECWATFLASALGARTKAKRPDYAASTLALAQQYLADDAALLEHGSRVADAILQSGQTQPANRRIRLARDSELDAFPPLRWLVKGIVPSAGIGAIFGDSGTYKSFLSLDLLASVANGRKWFGRRVKQAPAIYIPFEGQGGIPNRVRAWRLAQTYVEDPSILFTAIPAASARSQISVVMEPLNLRIAADRDALVCTLIETGHAGGILCIDTLAHASSGLDENSSAMAEMITIFRDLQARLGGVILLIHHSGKDQSRGMRGWSGLHAAMDFVIECQRDKDLHRGGSFQLTKVKDGSSGGGSRFRANLIQLGVDEDGDAIESLVIEPVEAVDANAEDGAPHPFKVETKPTYVPQEDDAFIDLWLRDLVTAGLKPTGRYLERGQLDAMKVKRPGFTQVRLRDAVERLKVEGRLVLEPGGPGHNKWLRPVDILAR